MCGTNNGTTNSTVTGGTVPYSYSWVPSGGTGSSLTSLSAGTYTLTVTDLNGCSTTSVTSITNYGGPSVTVSTSPVLCNGGNTGTASVSVTGGTIPYTYNWAPSGGTSGTAAALVAGTYTVTVTDSIGCTANAIANISQPAPIILSIVNTSVSCNNGADGTATVTATNGINPFSYSWLPLGGTSSTAIGLSSGTYSVTVMDANSCSSTITTSINQPAPIVLSVINTPVKCNGGNDGTASVTVSNGTSPYSYLWSPSGATTANAAGLSAGVNSVTVTDANGCSTNLSTTINQPLALGGSVINTPVSCFGANDGTATVSATGGTFPYLYSWLPTGGTSTNAFSLSAGTYSVTITDVNHCFYNLTTTVTQPVMPITATITNTPTHCNQNDGTATVNTSGGTAPYSYLWQPSGVTTASATGLSQGSYSVTITDANGCISSPITSITNVGAITAVITATPIMCYGDTNGTATASVIGGTAPYSYVWSNGQLTSQLTNLDEGTYCVNISDANGCSDTACITLVDPPAFSTDFTSDPTITDILNPEVHFYAQSGNIWQWSFGDSSGSNSQDPVHLYNNPGIFPVTLFASNNNGCVDTVVHQIIIQDIFTFYAPNAITPDDNNLNDVFLPKGTGWKSASYQLLIFDRWGNLCYSTTDPNKGWDGKANNGNEISEIDVYTWKVKVSDITEKPHQFIGTVTIVK